MECGRVALNTNVPDQQKLSRYLQYRAYLHDPLVIATDHCGEWSHHSRANPATYSLAVQDGMVWVGIQNTVVELKWQGEAGKALAGHLTHDPIWGPDWLDLQRAQS